MKLKSLIEITAADNKNTDKGTIHSYLEIYEKYFSSMRLEPITLLEIGILNGHSLEMWLEYFPKHLPSFHL